MQISRHLQQTSIEKLLQLQNNYRYSHSNSVYFQKILLKWQQEISPTGYDPPCINRCGLDWLCLQRKKVLCVYGPVSLLSFFLDFRIFLWLVSSTFQIAQIVVQSHFELVSSVLALEASEPVTQMAVTDKESSHFRVPISVQQKR